MSKEVKNTELVSLEAKAKGSKAVDNEIAENSASKNSAKKSVKTNKKSLGRRFKEIFSELKKVSWPTFAKVLKQTGVVLAVVLFFVVFIVLADLALAALSGLLVG